MEDFNSYYYPNGENAAPNIPNEKLRKKPQFIIAVVFLFLAFGLELLSVLSDAVVNYDTRGYGIGYLIGAVIGFWGLTAIITFFIFRFKSINKRATGLLILSIILFISQLSMFSNQIVLLEKWRAQEKATYKAFEEIIISRGDTKLAFSKETYGDNAEFLNMYVKELKSVMESRDTFFSKMEKLDISKYLNKESMLNESKVKAGVAEVEDVKQSLKSYEKAYKMMFSSIPEIVNSSSMSASMKEYILTGAEKAIGQNNLFEEYIKIEDQILDKYIQLLTIFKNDEGQFVFSEERSQKYDVILAEINELAKKEKDCIEKVQKNAEDLRKKLNIK